MFRCFYFFLPAVKTQKLLIPQKNFDGIIAAPSIHYLFCGDFNFGILGKSKRLFEVISFVCGNKFFMQNGKQATGETKTSRTCLDPFFKEIKQ